MPVLDPDDTQRVYEAMRHAPAASPPRAVEPAGVSGVDATRGVAVTRWRCTSHPVINGGVTADIGEAIVLVREPTHYVLHYRLRGQIGATTPEDAAGAMRDRGVLQAMGATDVRVVEVRR